MYFGLPKNLFVELGNFKILTWNIKANVYNPSTIGFNYRNQGEGEEDLWSKDR